jgi:hypothetical protein
LFGVGFKVFILRWFQNIWGWFGLSGVYLKVFRGLFRDGLGLI